MKLMRSALLLVLLPGASSAANPPDLFSEIFAASQPVPPRTLAAFPAAVNFTALNANPASISIELPGAGTFVAARVKFEQRPGGGYHWIGRTAVHDVVLTVDEDIITGFIRGGPDTYSIITGTHGQDGSTQSLQRMDAEAFPGDIVEEMPIAKVAKGSTLQYPDHACFGKDYDPVDVLLVYSPQALAAAGNDVAVLENEIYNAMASANVTLFNSLIPTTLNIVGLEPAPPTLVEVGNTNDLAAARNNAELIQRRREVHADVVTYITSVGVQSGNPYCGVTRTQRRAGNAFFGIGYDFYPSAVQVVTWQCGVQNNDISHEIGHNMGLDHNPPVFTQRPPNENLYPFAYGHEVNGLFRDDMSGSSTNVCPDGCPRQMFFSDPAQTYLGEPRGIEGEKDNAQVYRRSFHCVNTFADVILADGFE
jgi:hypothetical protein